MKKFELNKAYTVKYKGYNDREEIIKGLCIENLEKSSKFKTTEASSYSWFKSIEHNEIIDFGEINIIDFSEELVGNAEYNLKRSEDDLKEAQNRLNKVKKFIENRSFLGKIKNLLGCGINSENNNIFI